MSTNTLFGMLSFRPEEPSRHLCISAQTNQRVCQTKPVVTLKIGGKQKKRGGSVRWQVSYSRYVKNMLLGWCYSFGAEQLQDQALIWKDLVEDGIFLPQLTTGNNVSRPRKHKTAWLESSKKHEGFGNTFLLRIAPGIRNRPPASTLAGMIRSLSQWSTAVEK